MSELLTTAQMRAVEAAAMAHGAATGAGLMARAGAAVADAAADQAAEAGMRAARAVVLCGPGANGGDGYVAARLLAERGWAVEVFALGEADRAPPDAALMRARWGALGDLRPMAALEALAPGEGVMIDALFGAGLTRALPDAALAPWARLEAKAAPAWGRVVAVDAPSGLCLDSGRARGQVRAADLTVTFHRARPGHYLAEGPALCGALRVADIGCEGFGPAIAGDEAVALAAPDLGALRKDARGHKYDHGHVLALAGGVGRGGAARLAARSALRIGAGLVTVGAPGAALIENAARLDAVMLRRVDDAASLREALADARIGALVVGPGLGVGPRACALALAAVEAGRGVVLDANALTSLAADAGARAALFALTDAARVVMTPHWGEFARLFPALADAYGRLEEGAAAPSRLDMARAAAAQAGATVLLKGADTVIAAPGQATRICAASYGRAAPWLATAGSGDVLAGMIGGLLARGLPGPQAATLAAWLHQEAGRTLGAGLIAEDIPEALPALMARG